MPSRGTSSCPQHGTHRRPNAPARVRAPSTPGSWPCCKDCSLPLRTTIDRLHRDLLLGEPGRLYSELAASWLGVHGRERDRARGAAPTPGGAGPPRPGHPGPTPGGGQCVSPDPVVPPGHGRVAGPRFPVSRGVGTHVVRARGGERLATAQRVALDRPQGVHGPAGVRTAAGCRGRTRRAPRARVSAPYPRAVRCAAHRHGRGRCCSWWVSARGCSCRCWASRSWRCSRRISRSPSSHNAARPGNPRTDHPCGRRSPNGPYGLNGPRRLNGRRSLHEQRP